MPITIKTGTLKYKKSDGTYNGFNAIAQESTDQQLADIHAAGTAEVGAVTAKGQEVLESIPEDYTELEGEVDELKSAIDENATKENMRSPLAGITWVIAVDSMSSSGSGYNSYWDTVETTLAIPTANVTNTAVPGDTIGDMITRVPFPLSCDLWTVMCGTNDFGKNVPIATTTADLTALIAKVRQYNKLAKILVITSPQRFDKQTNTLGLALSDYVDAIIGVCGELSVPVMDLYGSGLINADNYTKYLDSGHLHFSQAGGVLVGEAISIFIPTHLELFGTSVYTDSAFSFDSENPLQNKTITDVLCEEKNIAVMGTVDVDTETVYGTTNSSCFILTTQVSADTPVSSITAKVAKASGATYKFKLVEYVQTPGKGIYTVTKLSDEYTFTEPSESSELLSIDFDEPFVVSAGHGLALISSDAGLFAYNSGTISEGGTYFVSRGTSVSYASVAVGTKLLNQTGEPTPIYKAFSAAVFSESIVAKEFITADEADTLIGNAIESFETIVDGKYSLAKYSYVPGDLLNGIVVPDANNRHIAVDKYVYLNAGDVIFCATTERITKITRYYNNFKNVDEVSNAASSYTITTSGYYKWAIDLQYNIGSTVLPYELSDNTFIGEINHYDAETLTALNEIMVTKDPFVISKEAQKMAHCAMMDYDASDKTMWVVYYANEATTTENNTDVRTYLQIRHFDPYKKEIIGETTFAVGDSIGNYTQSVTPPYDPTITVLPDYVLVTFWGNENNERCISCFRVDKTTLALSDYAVNKLSYNGVSYDLNCTNLKTVYEAYSGTTISDIDTVAFSCHFPVYNGEYYGVINDIFSESGYKSFLVKSTDLINWTIVHCFTEIPETNEASIAIRNGILYMADRTNGYITKYTMASGAVEFIKMPLCLMCKSCVYNFVDTLGNETIVLATNILAQYNAQQEGFRRNMGLFTIDEDLSVHLKSRVLTTNGCHYFDLASDGFDLFMLWSEDRRNLNRKVQRSDIAFSKMFI